MSGAHRIAFLIRSLEVGGAQRQLVELVKGLAAAGWEVHVLEMYGDGVLGKELGALPGVHRVDLHKAGRWDLIGFTWRLVRTVRRIRPDVVHGYLPVANELALLAGLMSGARVVWGLRLAGWWKGGGLVLAGKEEAPVEVPGGALFRLGALLSRGAALIISNSLAGQRFHIRHGYAAGRMHVIPNGIDTERFVADPERGLAARARWGIPAGAQVIGVAARIDPLKGVATFLEAVRLLADLPDLRAVWVGGGPEGALAELRGAAARLGLGDRFVAVGPEQDMAAAYSAFDLLVSPSIAEGFSNSIGEAMSAGRPCVVTDTGDSAEIVGDTGRVVPIGESVQLATAIRELLADLTPERRKAARARIVERYSRQRLVRDTEALLSEVATGRAVGG